MTLNWHLNCEVKGVHTCITCGELFKGKLVLKQASNLRLNLVFDYMLI